MKTESAALLPQKEIPEWKPAPAGQGPADRPRPRRPFSPSPEILPDNQVTFRLQAPDASEVLLNGDWEGGSGVPMVRDGQGLWSVTVGPLAPELWGYTFSVDGVRTLDPRNSSTKRDGARLRQHPAHLRPGVVPLRMEGRSPRPDVFGLVSLADS